MESGTEENAEVMPRLLNLSIDLFSGGSYSYLSFCSKETHAWFRVDYFCLGWRFARVGVGYPVSGTCSRSSFCKWRIGACLF